MAYINNTGKAEVLPNYKRSTTAITIVLIFLGFSLIIFGGLFGFTYYDSVITFHSTSIQENPSTYNPVTYFTEAQAKAGPNAKLYSLTANYVKSDGTMDLNANYTPGPSAKFTFYQPVPTPDNAPPPGVGSSSTWYQEISIEVEKAWSQHAMSNNTSTTRSTVTYYNFGIDAHFANPGNYVEGSPINPPKCSFADLWKTAIAKGANPDAVSIITYDQYGYNFTISGDKPFSLQFNSDCHTGDEAQAHR